MQAVLSTLEPVARIAVATLFNSLWEAAVLAFLVWLILRALPNVNATTRYAAWCIALAGALLLPLATALPQITVQRTAAVLPAAHVPAARIAPATSTARAMHAAAAARAGTPAETPAQPPAQLLPQRLRFALPEYVAIALFALWALAALALMVRLGVNLWRLERLKRDALPLPVDYRERLAQWRDAEKGGRDVRLCTCEGIDVPVAVGLFDAMILIPQHLLDTLAPDEIDQIMLHELGHLRRADDWTNGVQRVIQALFFFNPAILYIAQQLDLEREVACDDWVVRQTKNVRPYATCLTKMAEATAWPHRPLAAPGVFITRRGLSIRVERLLRAGRNVRTSVSFGPAGAVIAVLVVAFFLLQNVAPTFAFTLPQGAIAQASPAPKVEVRTVVHKQIEYRKVAAAAVATATASPAPRPRATDIVIPAQHIHIPAQTIPPVNVDIPERRIHVTIPPSPNVYFPPNFSKNLQKTIDASLKQSMNAVRQSMDAMQAGMESGKFVHGQCTSCDFSGKNLAGHSFRGQHLNEADFSHANLQNADFSNAVLAGVDFSHADLRGASFVGAVLSACDLSAASIAGARFDGAKMSACDFDARSFSPSQARDVVMACRAACDLSGANLQGQSLRNLRLSAVDLSGADLRGADISGSTFAAVDFENARFDGSRATGAVFENCGLDDSDAALLASEGARIVNHLPQR